MRDKKMRDRRSRARNLTCDCFAYAYVWLKKMEFCVIFGILLVSHLTKCVEAVLPNYLPALSLDARQDRILRYSLTCIKLKLD